MRAAGGPAGGQPPEVPARHTRLGRHDPPRIAAACSAPAPAPMPTPTATPTPTPARAPTQVPTRPAARERSKSRPPPAPGAANAPAQRGGGERPTPPTGRGHGLKASAAAKLVNRRARAAPVRGRRLGGLCPCPPDPGVRPRAGGVSPEATVAAPSPPAPRGLPQTPRPASLATAPALRYRRAERLLGQAEDCRKPGARPVRRPDARSRSRPRAALGSHLGEAGGGARGFGVPDSGRPGLSRRVHRAQLPPLIPPPGKHETQVCFEREGAQLGKANPVPRAALGRATWTGRPLQVAATDLRWGQRPLPQRRTCVL